MKHISHFLDEYLDEWFEEIAGKHEHETGLTQEEAEQRAKEEVAEWKKQREASK